MISALWKPPCLHNFIQSLSVSRAACTCLTWACCSSLAPRLVAASVFSLWHSSHSPAAHKELLKPLEIRPWGWKAGGWWSRPRSIHRERGIPPGPAWTHRTRARPRGSELVLRLCWPWCLLKREGEIIGLVFASSSLFSICCISVCWTDYLWKVEYNLHFIARRIRSPALTRVVASHVWLGCTWRPWQLINLNFVHCSLASLKATWSLEVCNKLTLEKFDSLCATWDCG